MKLCAFIQMYNEVEKGNLVRCLNNAKQWADDICIYDDASADTSVEIASRYTPHIVRGETNALSRELYHKQQLLEYALTLAPDWIMWIDCDEVLDREATTGGLRALAETAPNDVDAFSFHQLNLWRSQTYARVDSLFDDPNQSWFCRLWRVVPGLHLNTAEGVHLPLWPSCEKVIRSRHRVIHYGFWNYKQMLAKIHADTWDQETFVRLAPSNWILDERDCQCVRVLEDLFPVENIPPDVWEQPGPRADCVPYSELPDTSPLSMVAGKASQELWSERHHDNYHGVYATIHERNRNTYVKSNPEKRACMFHFNPAGKRIVDIGCGGGAFALDSIANGAEIVYCLEIDQQIIDVAQRSFNELQVPVEKYEFIKPPDNAEVPAESIDVVYCMAVFMHIPLCEVHAYLRWIRTILKADGEVHLQFHQVNGTTLFRSDGIPDHGYRIPDESVDAMIAEIGLNIVDKTLPRGEHLEPVWTLYTCKRNGG